MNSLAGRSSEIAPSRDSIISERRRQLRSWAFRRCVLCFVCVFPIACLVTQRPFWFGPDYGQAVLLTLGAVAFDGFLLYLRIHWELFRLDADLADATRPYQLGRRVARLLRTAVQ